MQLNQHGNRNLITHNNESSNNEPADIQELMSDALALFDEHTSDELSSDGELMSSLVDDIMSTESDISTPGKPLWAYAEASDNKPCPIIRAEEKRGITFWGYTRTF